MRLRTFPRTTPCAEATHRFRSYALSFMRNGTAIKSASPGEGSVQLRRALPGAADRRPFAEDNKLDAANERVSHYSLLGGR